MLDHIYFNTPTNQANKSRTTIAPDPSIPSRDGRCFFFTLPRELRDEIYEYALTEEWGLASHHRKPYSILVAARGPPSGTDEEEMNQNWEDDRLAEASAMKSMESNRLVYVCRQLHRETLGLGLKFNDLTFYHTEKMCALSHFGRFIQHCPTTLQRYVRKITVVQDNSHRSWVWYDKFVMKSLAGDGVAAPLYNFCLTHPDVQAVVRFNPILDRNLLEQTMILHLAHRGIADPILSSGFGDPYGHPIKGPLPVSLPREVERYYRADASRIYHMYRSERPSPFSANTNPLRDVLENLRFSIVPFWNQNSWFLNSSFSVHTLTQENFEQLRRLFEEGA
ncbi:hypothetical protein K505DRAFT_342715 [Melanomma pulvis-pyrius CBS 109.77]|uniref:Uncharacterized protein n=1 Tax=Melanomma pulvis-pyrius CBS 109.77 TaxID=1314802 RepID=A0A6A6WU38_9PLEO|nr:hypothetical protein K505DRAFT_342715 [Melanomma pulvis-pyrius CBS 109.77]